MADAPTSLIGEVLQDTYRIERQLGGGGMGVVYEAVHVRLPDKRYAIKVLSLAPGARMEESQRRELFQRFRREAEIASRLGHPHIVEGHDFHTLPGGEPYLVMEHLDGEDLAARIRRAGPLPIRSVRRIASEVASALEAAHQARVIHRDLKPSNIFLCQRAGRDDYAKLLDFGLAKLVDSASMLTQADTLLGTAPYMAPEQARGQAAEADARADVFAFGAIVWEMLSGKMAFDAPNLAATVAAVLQHHPPPVHTLRSGVPPAVSAVLAQAMAKDPAQRFTTAGELARRLEAAFEEGESATRDDRPAPPPPKRRRRRRLAIAVTVGIAAGAAVGVLAARPWASPAGAPGDASGSAGSPASRAHPFLGDWWDPRGREWFRVELRGTEPAVTAAVRDSEPYPIASSRFDSARLSYTYRVDRTGYLVTRTIAAVADDAARVEWKNDHGDSGAETMVRVERDPRLPSRPGSDADCAAAEACRVLGSCALVDGACRPRGAQDCARSRVCELLGACQEIGSQCLARDEAACAATLPCKRWGACDLHEGRCGVAVGR